MSALTYTLLSQVNVIRVWSQRPRLIISRQVHLQPFRRHRFHARHRMVGLPLRGPCILASRWADLTGIQPIDPNITRECHHFRHNRPIQGRCRHRLALRRPTITPCTHHLIKLDSRLITWLLVDICRTMPCHHITSRPHRPILHNHTLDNPSQARLSRAAGNTDLLKSPNTHLLDLMAIGRATRIWIIEGK